MVDLTPSEIKALLWHVHVVEQAFGADPPEGSVIRSAKAKLLAQLTNGDVAESRMESGR